MASSTAAEVAPQQVSQPCQQLRHRKRFGQVVIPTLLQPLHPVIHRAPGGQDQHRARHARSPQFLDQVKPILIRQTEIDDQYVVRILGRKQCCSSAILSRVHLVSGFRKRFLEECLNLDFILHEQELHSPIVERGSLIQRGK